MSILRLLVCLSICLFSNLAFSQDSTSLYSKLNNVSEKYLSSISVKSQSLENKLDYTTQKLLRRLQKQERLLHKKLAAKDSILARNIFSESEANYSRIQNEFKNKSKNLLKRSGEYYAWLDTAHTTLMFLDKLAVGNNNLESLSKLKSALNKVQSIEDQIKRADNVKEFIHQRKEFLKKSLSKYNLGKSFTKFNKEVWYYEQQINEYKSALSDPTKIEKKVLSILRDIPAFKGFFKQYGFLAGLFDIPNGYAQNMTGLQTRGQIQSMIQQRLGAMGPNASQTMQQNLQSSMSSLNQMKERLHQSGSDLEMPDFKPNMQRVKSFRQRLEFGSNFQTTKSNNYFPNVADIGLSVGYKLNDKSVVGVGGSYKLGLGKNFKHIAFSHQGLSLRTFAEYKFKGSFWFTGGMELNYLSQFYDFGIFKNYSSWQKSGLLGISKKYSLGKKFNGKIQVLYDLLHAQQIPKGRAIIFRMGYNFK